MLPLMFLLLLLSRRVSICNLPCCACFFRVLIEFITVGFSLPDLIFDVAWDRSGVFALYLRQQLRSRQFLGDWLNEFWFVRQVFNFDLFSCSSLNNVFNCWLSNRCSALVWANFDQLLLAILFGNLCHSSKWLLRLKRLLFHSTWGESWRLLCRKYTQRCCNTRFLVLIASFRVGY